MPRISKKDCITALQLASQANPYAIESPDKVLTRAAAYLPFIVRGPVLEPGPKDKRPGGGGSGFSPRRKRTKP